MKRTNEDSGSFLWTPTEESFNIFGASYDVGKAKRIIDDREARPVYEIDVEELRFLARIVETDPKFCPKSIPGVIFPLIAIRIGHGILPIDGWHRIKYALRNGIETLRVVVLSAKEREEILTWL